MKKILTMCTIFLTCLVLSSCTMHRQDAGMLAGGVVGGAAGHVLTGGSPIGAVAGAVGGAYVGHELSR